MILNQIQEINVKDNSLVELKLQTDKNLKFVAVKIVEFISPEGKQENKYQIYIPVLIRSNENNNEYYKLSLQIAPKEVLLQIKNKKIVDQLFFQKNPCTKTCEFGFLKLDTHELLLKLIPKWVIENVIETVINDMYKTIRIEQQNFIYYCDSLVETAPTQKQQNICKANKLILSFMPQNVSQDVSEFIKELYNYEIVYIDSGQMKISEKFQCFQQIDMKNKIASIILKENDQLKSYDIIVFNEIEFKKSEINYEKRQKDPNG